MRRWSPWKRYEPAEPSPIAAPPAFVDLYRQRMGYVWHVLRRLGVKAREREDVSQEVFVCVHRALPRFDPARPVLPWLHGIAFHVAKNHLRRHRAHPQETLVDNPSDLDQQDPASDPEQQTAAREIVIRLMQTIDLDRRVVLSMHDLDGMAMADIARELRITEAAGYKRLQTARRELQAAADRLSARERFTMGVAAVVPVDLTMLLDADRTIPDVPPSTSARVWARLQAALALGDVVHAAGVSAVEAPAAPSLAARLGAQVVPHIVPFLLGALVGAAGLYALTPRATPRSPPLEVKVQASPGTASLSDAPSSTVPVATASSTAATSAPATASASSTAGPAMDEEELLQHARAARARDDLKGALAALDKHARRYPAGRLAATRDALRAQILDQQRAASAPSSTPAASSPSGTAPPVPAPHRMFGTEP